MKAIINKNANYSVQADEADQNAAVWWGTRVGGCSLAGRHAFAVWAFPRSPAVLTTSNDATQKREMKNMWGERSEDRGKTDQCENLGADGGHAEHRVESAVDVRHELLLLVPEPRTQHTQHATRVRNTRALSCTIHTSIQYEYTTKDEYESNTSVKMFKSIICCTLTEQSMRYRILYIMQCKLPLDRRQMFMRRATEYSSVKSVSSSWFSRAPTSQLIIPPAMRADCTERLQEVSGHMYVQVPVCLNVYSK